MIAIPSNPDADRAEARRRLKGYLKAQGMRAFVEVVEQMESMIAYLSERCDYLEDKISDLRDAQGWGSSD